MMLEFHERVGQNLKWNINYTSSKFKGDLSMDVNSSLRRWMFKTLKRVQRTQNPKEEGFFLNDH